MTFLQIIMPSTTKMSAQLLKVCISLNSIKSIFLLHLQITQPYHLNKLAKASQAFK